MVLDFSEVALEALRRYSYPVNVRKLRNIIQWTLTFSEGGRVTKEDLPARVRDFGRRDCKPMLTDGSSYLEGLPTVRERQQAYVKEVLTQVDGNKRRAAHIIGIGRRTLFRWLDA